MQRSRGVPGKHNVKVCIFCWQTRLAVGCVRGKKAGGGKSGREDAMRIINVLGELRDGNEKDENVPQL
jgi:hypothetical protein